MVSLRVCIVTNTQSIQNNQFTIPEAKVKDEVDFLQISIKGFFKLILSFSVYVARHVQITKNSKIAISLQCLKKEASDEVDFFACRQA